MFGDFLKLATSGGVVCDLHLNKGCAVKLQLPVEEKEPVDEIKLEEEKNPC